ncbi:MAG: site-specific integrase [Lamprobacter sp.]|uniref:tyrosine-type recombinase/integrase n=1 Tax=Lamprobacter sp. TaxID=3100796 RepID=UPI002B25CE85|nr:site-specific integrase [Lamprobacter sp.]MEA3639921.1 site-specific integrase [Lamprobacter sp.]
MASIYPLSSGKWRAQIRRKGHRPVSRLFATKKAAERWVRTQEVQLDTTRPGEMPGTDPLSKLLKRYEDEGNVQAKRGHVNETSRLRLFLAELGHLTVAELDKGAIIAYARRRLKSVCSDTVRRELMQLSGILTHARDEWGYRPEPGAIRSAQKYLESKRVLKPKVKRTRRLRPGEYKRLLRGLKDNPRMRVIVRLMIETGLRREEVAKLKRSALVGEGLWVIDDKMGGTTLIPISMKARRLLEGMPEEGFGMRPDSITQAFNRALKRVGITDLRPHDLRHEAVSRLFEKGLTVQEVAMISRHSDWRSLKIYTQPSVAKVTEKLG